MSGSDDDQPLLGEGRRKDGKPYKEGNTREDGSYAIGRNRAPEKGRFQAGDGRKRGRRPKGVRNADTDFEKELDRKVTIREDGKVRKIPKSLAIDLRLIDKAARQGDTRAIEMVDARRRRIAEMKLAAESRYHSLNDQQILEAYLRQRAAELSIDPGLFGDPEPDN